MIRPRFLLFISLLTIMSCKIVNEPATANDQSYSTYRLATSEASGWTELADTAGWKPFAKNTMNALVDGEADFFTDEGMVEGAQQRLVNSADEKLMIWVLDFSTNSAAKKMYQKCIAEKVPQAKAVKDFNESVAIMNITGEGCTTYAIFDAIILRLSFENYNDVNKSYSDASQFLGVFKKK
jgi:hypothetical protein